MADVRHPDASDRGAAGPQDRPLRDIEQEITELDDEPLTRREALETELMEEGRSEEGEDADLEADIGPGEETPEV